MTSKIAPQYNQQKLMKKEFIMSIFNMTTNTVSKIKDVSLALVFISAVVGTSVSANAATTVEGTVNDFVVAQGKSMVAELNTKLQQSINKEIDAFSTNFSLNNASTWLKGEKPMTKGTLTINEAVGKLGNQTNTSKNINKNQTK